MRKYLKRPLHARYGLTSDYVPLLLWDDMPKINGDKDRDPSIQKSYTLVSCGILGMKLVSK